MRVLFILLLGALASGCLRQRFDLCSQTPPHPECLIDSGPIDAAIDANRDAATDALTSPDAFTAEPDAFASPDAFTPEPDAFAPPDAFTPDAFVPLDTPAEDAP